MKIKNTKKWLLLIVFPFVGVKTFAQENNVYKELAAEVCPIADSVLRGESVNQNTLDYISDRWVEIVQDIRNLYGESVKNMPTKLVADHYVVTICLGVMFEEHAGWLTRHEAVQSGRISKELANLSVAHPSAVMSTANIVSNMYKDNKDLGYIQFKRLQSTDAYWAKYVFTRLLSSN